ncbi:hypothetical protein Pst134EA_033148 [Puccinia striiformis f. sp. tritici]|uniref:hypothetical protein n=1 Tax=Puccinia striiformis f. sp. tritici TaxID=168172 RepID=UPI002008D48C|nr:hypothetical protein Pst134EA_033148 [Puccinia striiformis f. sp. tritici]KAH9450278.1 hypothetical protein Pst134EA_033148 [Puccinia striiformis f. sp. tritici]
MPNHDAPPHQSRAALEEVKLQLEELKIVNQAIKTGADSFSSAVRRLAADGSNFEAWAENIQDAGNTHLGKSDFFTTATTNHILEKIGRGIFLASIDESLRSDVQLAKKCIDMHALVTKKFKTVSRAAQMNTWRKFKAFNLDEHPSSAGIASRLRNLATEWKSLKLTFTEDTFLGFVLQDSVGQTSVVAQDFTRRVESLVQADPENPTPTFEKLVHILEICRQQHSLTTGSVPQPATPSIFTQQPSSVLQSTVSPSDSLPSFDQGAYLQGIHPDDWTEALNCYSVTANRCWGCGNSSHYLSDCPTRSRGAPVSRRARGPGTYSFRQNHNRQPVHNPAPFYPIIGAMYPPPGLPFPPQQQYPQFQQPTQYQQPYHQQQFQNYAPPAQNNYRQPGLRQADSFKPEYSSAPPQQHQRSQASNRSTLSGGASARNVEAEGLGEDLSEVDFRSMTANIHDQPRGPEPAYQAQETCAFGRQEGQQ